MTACGLHPSVHIGGIAPRWHVARNLSFLSDYLGNATVKSTSDAQFSKDFRFRLFHAHRGVCAYCGSSLNPETFHVDHVSPKSSGGSDGIRNLVACCNTCNLMKGKSDLETLRLRIAFRKSPLYGLIQPNQAAKLMQLGIELPIVLQPFYFEMRYADGMLYADGAL